MRKQTLAPEAAHIFRVEWTQYNYIEWIGRGGIKLQESRDSIFLVHLCIRRFTNSDRHMENA